MCLIPINECVRGRIYRLRSRNLSFGVFDGQKGFIGIRQKFKRRYLDTEYHWDAGPPYGTVSEQIDIGVNVPIDIPLAERLEPEGRPNEELFKFLEQAERIDAASQKLAVEEAVPRVQQWWQEFLNLNSNKPDYVLRLIQELSTKGATLQEFYAAYKSGEKLKPTETVPDNDKLVLEIYEKLRIALDLFDVLALRGFEMSHEMQAAYQHTQEAKHASKTLGLKERSLERAGFKAAEINDNGEG